jgi:hypothetical protein
MACLLLAPGCNALVSFGDFKFGSDAGIVADSGSAGSSGAGSDAAVSDSGPHCSADTSSETQCSDGRDNDCDGLDDCNDPDCSNDAHCCQPSAMTEMSCSGGKDEDCDGQIDCADPDCSSSEACCGASGAEVGNTACGDGVDNDCDGIVDCKEMACQSQNVCCVPSGAENDTKHCGDGLDNDCDGKKDCADPDCAVVSNCCVKGEAVEKSCEDAKDNDCDGLSDCRDPDCAGLTVCTQCKPVSEVEMNCRDLKDDDCDKDRDCLDSDCAHDPACCVPTGAENSNAACTDGIDNDCDGQLDCADSDCTGTLDCCVATGPETGEACRDDRDNDCDGLINCQDPGCAGSQNCCQSAGPELGVAACSDHVDNDCDGALDCADSDCKTAASCCTPSGSESSQPNDGKDNDCDGQVDIPILNSAYPPPGLPASGDEVIMVFAPSIVANAGLECSSRRIAQNSVPVFVACPGSGGRVTPHSAAAASDAANDGAWVTDVRWRFPSGAHSQVFSLKYYIHHTLYKAVHCMSPIKDSDWFNKAGKVLNNPMPGLFKPEDTLLANPFIRVTYEPPNANSVRIEFEQNGTAQKVEMWSLRRRFVLSPDNKFLLITRNYKSNRSSQCLAAHFRIHDAHHVNNNNIESYGCDAVVLNRQGAGVCLRDANGIADFSHYTSDPIANSLGWVPANKFMWRQLLDESGHGEVHDYAHDESVSYRNFTAKCSVQPCTNPHAIYLPDRALFP